MHICASFCYLNSSKIANKSDGVQATVLTHSLLGGEFCQNQCFIVTSLAAHDQSSLRLVIYAKEWMLLWKWKQRVIRWNIFGLDQNFWTQLLRHFLANLLFFPNFFLLQSTSSWLQSKLILTYSRHSRLNSFRSWHRGENWPFLSGFFPT